MKLGEKIQDCRRKAGMSQETLAALTGVSRQAVSKWETGESVPEVGKVVQLARIFGVTTDWLLLEEESPAEETPCAQMETTAQAAASWVEAVPGVLGKLLRRYGWLFGVRMAVGGGVFAAFGLLMKALFRNFTVGMGSFTTTAVWFDEAGNPVANPGVSDEQLLEALGQDFVSLGAGAERFSGPEMIGDFVLILGVVTLIAGVVLAAALRRQRRA